MALGNVHITPQLVQAVRDAADIVSIASEHTKLRKAGRRYQGLCPIHKEKTPSFSVDPVQGLFYCFGCGAGGDAIKLHMLSTGDDFPAAIESLATRYGIPLPSRETKAGSRTERDLEGALQAAQAFFTDQLRKSSFAREYLENRKIPPELIERFGLGYAPDSWRTLIPALQARIGLADLEAAGLVGRSEKGGEPYDRFRNRLMFPIHNSSGRLVGFGGRTLGDDKAKYINSNETDRFHKGLLLYGLHLAKKEIRESGRAVLCEGYFDVIGAVACGLEGAVAGMGTALTPEQTKQLARFATEVLVAYDGDNAGDNAFRRALPLLLEQGLKVHRVRFPGNHDPDSLRISDGPAAVTSAVEAALDAVSEEINRNLPPAHGKDLHHTAEAAKKVLEIIRPIKDHLTRVNYVLLAANRLSVDPKYFLGLVFGKDEAFYDIARKLSPSGLQETHDVPSLEEQVLGELLQREEPIPPADGLPPPEVFLDMECRNIYQVFCALYAGAGSRPEVWEMIAALGHGGEMVARLAAILRKWNPGAERRGLLETTLDNLVRRWGKRRLQELVTQISEAERRNDQAQLNRLLEERKSLSWSLHRGARPSARGGAA